MTSLEIPSLELATHDGLQHAIWRRLTSIPIQAELIRQGAARRVVRELSVVIGKPAVPGPETEGFLAIAVTVHGAREDRAAVTATADEVEQRLRGAVLSEAPRIELREHRVRTFGESLSERRPGPPPRPTPASPSAGRIPGKSPPPATPLPLAKVGPS